MARESYQNAKNIHDMTTRELRGYIYDMSREAQERLDSIDLEDSTRAFRDKASDIIGRNGKVRKSTSNMTKEEMREYAYSLRDFASMDVESGYAKSIDWQENKSRYQTFIKNRKDDPFWSQFITAKGNVSKKGYEEYKKFIGFVKSVEDVKLQYTYRTLLEKGTSQIKQGGDSKTRLDAMGKILNKVYADNKGKGLTTNQLVDKFNEAWEEYQDKQSAGIQKEKAIKHIPSTKRKKQKSSSNIKVKTTRKMRTHGTVHE